MRASVRIGDSLEGWWQVLFALRRQTLPYLVTDEAWLRPRSCGSGPSHSCREVAERFYSYQQSLAEKRNQILREMGQKLITTFDIGQLAEIMAQELPNLGIKSCYLALYEPHPLVLDGTQAGAGWRRKGIRRSGPALSWFMRTSSRLN